MTKIYWVVDELPEKARRLRARRAPYPTRAEIEKWARRAAGQIDCMVVSASHGGTVPNCYDYPAFTGAPCTVVVLLDAVADMALAVTKFAVLPANKTTASGIIAAAWDERYRPVKDLRFGPEKTAAARLELREEVLRYLEDGLESLVKDLGAEVWEAAIF